MSEAPAEGLRRHGLHAAAGAVRSRLAPLKSERFFITAKKTFVLDDLIEGGCICVPATVQAIRSMKPEKIIASVIATATYTAPGRLDRTIAQEIPLHWRSNGSSIRLLAARFGEVDLFARWPDSEDGIPIEAFAPDTIGGGISYPVLNEGDPVEMVFGVGHIIQYHLRPPPRGYGERPQSVTISIRLDVHGHALREWASDAPATDGHTERLRQAIVAAGRPLAGADASPAECVDAVRQATEALRLCAQWTGPGGDCTTCGVAAYDHPGAPTPAGRRCKKFICNEPTATGPVDAERCDFCVLPARDHEGWRESHDEWIRQTVVTVRRAAAAAFDPASLGSGIAWPEIPADGGDWPAQPIAAACERARAFLGALEYLPVADERTASELRHRLRDDPGVDVLKETALFISGVHPAREGQRELVAEMLRVLDAPPERPQVRIWQGFTKAGQAITVEIHKGREERIAQINRIVAKCIREWPGATAPRQGGGPTYAEGLRAFWIGKLDTDPTWEPPDDWAGPYIASKSESAKVLGINPALAAEARP